MAYFDSSKNRALWAIRLTELKKERAAREAGETVGMRMESSAMERTAAPSRVRVTYQELLKEEAMASKTAEKRRPVRERMREREMAAEKTSREPSL